MTDRGLAALATALHEHGTMGSPTVAMDSECLREAAAILGERGVFLPEGLPIPADVGHRNAHDPDALLITEAELARAVLKACDHNGWGVYRTLAGGASWIDRRTVSAAILAEIREATDAV